MELKTYLSQKRKEVEDFILNYFNEPFSPSILYDAIKYSLFAGGKRIRPILCLSAADACGNDYKNILPQACAIELIHTYSLIHDDLPAMDDDDLRRGKPTNHKVFGEAMAILAGDGLLTEAFLMFSRNASNIAPELLVRAIRELAANAGLYGMIAGQAMDIISEGKAADRETLEFIHKNKTAALIKASVSIGGILSGADDNCMNALYDYGSEIGLAFQIVDDILDITSTTEELGKPIGSDDDKFKMTYPSLYGLDGSKQIARQCINNAMDAAKILGDTKACWLKEIALYLLERTN
ncbi:geranylgeranyl pyrophosphate synthase [Candidatus Magnetoovum chiemensis]|nr:geranylgeranyl pyrophosphate synthase [Candidatus Magnetoovum chiemensis]